MAKKFKDIVKIRWGTMVNAINGMGYETLNEAQKAEADCGCGIDCCDNELKLRDKDTQNTVALYFDGGEFKLRDTTGAIFTVTIVAD